MKYKDHSVKELKKALSNLKHSNSELTEIKYVSRILRKKIRNHSDVQSNSNRDDSFHHDNYVERNFWGYVKNVLNRKDKVLPSFSIAECVDYFTKTLTAFHPNKVFHIPSWIPRLSDLKCILTLTRLLINKLPLLFVK